MLIKNEPLKRHENFYRKMASETEWIYKFGGTSRWRSCLDISSRKQHIDIFNDAWNQRVFNKDYIVRCLPTTHSDAYSTHVIVFKDMRAIESDENKGGLIRDSGSKEFTKAQ